MPASALWLLPTLVSSGDVLEITSITGAGNDGALIRWQCPSGLTFFTGACLPNSGATDGGDPLPSVFHMRILYLIDGTYYDAMAGQFTVPGGIANKEVDLLVNDAALADNSGSYQFEVCVTNNAALSWSHHFTGNDLINHWTLYDDGTYGPRGLWTFPQFVSITDPVSSPDQWLYIYLNPPPGTYFSYGVDLTTHQDAGVTGFVRIRNGTNGNGSDLASSGLNQLGLLFTQVDPPTILIGAVNSGSWLIDGVTLTGAGSDPF
jgi:hypothetical protein